MRHTAMFNAPMAKVDAGLTSEVYSTQLLDICTCAIPMLSPTPFCVDAAVHKVKVVFVYYITVLFCSPSPGGGVGAGGGGDKKARMGVGGGGWGWNYTVWLFR